MQAITKRLKHFKRGKRGISTVIVVMLSLVLVVIIVGNVVLWNYQMNQLDIDRMQETLSFTNVTTAVGSSAFNPSSYVLGESTQKITGAISDLKADDSAYMIFRSYTSAEKAQPLFCHSETTTIAGSDYYQLKLDSADSSGSTVSADASSTGRKLLAKFMYPLSGVTTIPESTWTIYYRASADNPAEATCNVDVLIRQANGEIRTTIATEVANSNGLGRDMATVSGTYSWSSYSVVAQTDFLEIDFYAVVTRASPQKEVYLRIDDSTLKLKDQTRIDGITLPSSQTIQLELTGTGSIQSEQQLMWTLNSAFTAASVTTTYQIYNFNTGKYPTSGDGYINYVSSSTPNTDETKSQTITQNPTFYLNSTGAWKIRITAVKDTAQPFDLKLDWVEYKAAVSGTSSGGALMEIKNSSPLTIHVVAVWITDATTHQRYDVDWFLNSGETAKFNMDINLPQDVFVAKVVTERGNIAVFSSG